MSTYSHIVVGIDGSPTSGQVVRTASSLARAYGAALTVVSAYQEESTPAVLKESAEEFLDEAARIAAEEGAAEYVRLVARPGSAETILLEVIEEMGADLLVVGGVGLDSSSSSDSSGALTRKGCGHIPIGMAQRAQVDVLVVNSEVNSKQPCD